MPTAARLCLGPAAIERSPPRFAVRSALLAITFRFVYAGSAAARLRRAFAVADRILASLAVRSALYYDHCWLRPRRPRRATLRPTTHGTCTPPQQL
jgi:hypothetical protein